MTEVETANMVALATNTHLKAIGRNFDVAPDLLLAGALGEVIGQLAVLMGPDRAARELRDMADRLDTVAENPVLAVVPTAGNA